MTVRTEQQEHVTTVVIDRIDARNAVDHSTADLLTEAFLAFDADPDARVAVFWGAGGTFCAGYDLKYAATLADPDAFRRDFTARLDFPTTASSRAARWVRRVSRCRSP
jgi:enoyl-CoA hydratase